MKGWPSSPGWTVTFAPWVWSVWMWACTDFMASCGSIPGPSRMENFALAVCRIEFDESAMEVVSTPMILSAALFQSRSASSPVPTSSRSETEIGRASCREREEVREFEVTSYVAGNHELG